MKRFLVLTGLSVWLFCCVIPASRAADISEQQAASIAQSQYPGRVIDVKPARSAGTVVYRVKVLDASGGMHIVIIDKQNGNVISAH